VTTAVLEDLGVLTDDELAAMYRAADDDAAARAALAEAGRRDAADRVARARDVLAGIRHEAECAVHAQYLKASGWCRGRLLSREGTATDVAERDLWRLPADRVARLGSEELGDFFLYVEPRITVASYVHARAAESRAAAAQWRDAQAAGAGNEITDDDWSSADDEHDAGGPGLAADDASAFRPGPAAAQAPQAGGRGTVPGGRRGTAHDAEAQHGGAGTRRAGGPAQSPRGVTAMTAAFTTFDTIDPLPTEPLWPGFWPRGEVVGWYGEGGLGKGRAELDLAARVTRGDPMPFCTGRTRPGSVILVLPEDHPAEQVRPRLDAAGADVSRVVDMTRLATGSRFKLSATMTKDGDVGQLREAIETLRVMCAACHAQMRDGQCPGCGGTEDMNPRLVIIDPLTAVIGYGSISTVAGARRALEPLQDVAASTGVCILLVMHSTKAGVLQGSAGIKQSLRLLYKITKDVNPMVRVISLEKGNNQGETPDAKFTLEDSAAGVRVIWLDRAEQDARARSWRTPAPEPVTGTVGALLGLQRPGEAKAAVTVLGRYPLGELGERTARTRCEAHPRFRPGAGWQQTPHGLLSTYVAPDGSTVWFGITAVAG
jgi:AAA domain-containing protein